MKRAMLLSAVAVAFAFPGQALATGTGLRTITGMGCHLHDNTCWVLISGTAVGPTSCRTNTLRFDSSLPNGKNILSMVTGAYLAGRQANFEVVDTACYTPQSGDPTIAWMNF